MSAPTRRQFLHRGGAAALLSGLPPLIQRALAVEPLRRSGSLEDVQHIVILTQENRSFDHYFGTLAGVRGFGDPFPVPVCGDGAARTVFAQPLQGAAPGLLAPFRLDTSRDFRLMRALGTHHHWNDAQAAWDQGRMGRWTEAKQNHAMGYFAEDDLPFQFALARAFTVCDHYHCATQTGTNTNRLFLWSGHNDPAGRAGGPSIDNSHDNFKPEADSDYRWITYAERLQAAGISWQVYQDPADNFTDNPLAGFRPFRDAHFRRPGYSEALAARGIAGRSLEQLREDVLADRLPQVSWIIATAEGCEHPEPSSPAQGADYTARVLEALTANPKSWSQTVLLLNFDENDGFFDHMPPPAVPAYLQYDPDPARARRAGDSTVDTAGEYHHLPGGDPRFQHRPYGLGPRVPMYLISPWTRGGWVNSQVHDHSSVIRFIEARFGVEEPLISPWRRAVSGNLLSCFDFAGGGRIALPAWPETAARRLAARALSSTHPPQTPEGLRAPVQAHGQRPARPLPYELQVDARLDGRRLRLGFHNRGEAGAVFHVYDRCEGTALPRRYTVEGGQSLEGDWELDEAGYDLWVLGPNGFHRHFIGRPMRGGEACPEWTLQSDRQSGRLLMRLSNRGEAACTLRLHSPRYPAQRARTLRLGPGASQTLRLDLAAQDHWYDFCLGARELPDFVRRAAGHLETGAPSRSDPALGGPALLEPWRP